jgi:hypothetical protein
MNKSYLTVVLTLSCVFGLGITTRAQESEGVRVEVPFEFVAGGATLPPGTYSVDPLSLDAHSGIAIRSYEHGALVLPMVVDESRAGQSKLSFEHVGDKYFLSEVDTPTGVYTLASPRVVPALAQVKDQGVFSPSGTK